MTYKNIRLDFSGLGPPVTLHVMQYSAALLTVVAELYNNGTAYTIPAGSTVRVRERKPGGTIVYNTVTSWTGNTITYALDAQFTAMFGLCVACFEIDAGSAGVLETPAFFVDCAKNPVQSTDIQNLDSVREIEAFAASMEKSATAAAGSATAAASSASAAEKSASSAAGSANAAASSANTANAQAGDASAYAKAAAASAQTATAKASSAQSYAATAQAAATQAAGSASASVYSVGFDADGHFAVFYNEQET